MMPTSPRPSAAIEHEESSPVLVSEGTLTPMPQPSFSAVVRSPPAPPRGAFGLLVFAMRLVTSEADLTVGQLRSPNYEGSVNYLRVILDNGEIASEIPEVPAERYDALLCAVLDISKSALNYLMII